MHARLPKSVRTNSRSSPFRPIQGWEAFPFSISTYGGPSTEGEGTATVQNGEHLDHYFFFFFFRWPDAWESPDTTLPM